jgi:hypothetical protein
LIKYFKCLNLQITKKPKKMTELIKIQSELKAPKNQFNAFGKYKYRNCEDILEALKPYLLKYGCMLTISDQIKEAGGLIYCESIVQLTLPTGILVTTTGCAGIDPNRKGMDIAQSFGSSSSYARKYALSGMFALDDTKDSDATNTHGKAPETKPKKIALVNGSAAWKQIVEKLAKNEITISDVEAKCDITEEQREMLMDEAI